MPEGRPDNTENPPVKEYTPPPEAGTTPESTLSSRVFGSDSMDGLKDSFDSLSKTEDTASPHLGNLMFFDPKGDGAQGTTGSAPSSIPELEIYNPKGSDLLAEAITSSGEKRRKASDYKENSENSNVNEKTQQ